MFIDVTRLGGSNVRLAPIAIAYLDNFRSGCHIHLVGGDYIRVEESRLEVELRARSGCADSTAPVEPAFDPMREMVAGDIGEPASNSAAADGAATPEEPAGRRRGRGR